MLVHLAWLCCLLPTVGFAVWRGGWDERVTALVLVLADRAAALHHPQDAWRHLDLVSPGLDLILLLFLLHRAMVTTRWWPLYACAAQLGATLGLARMWFAEESLLRSYFVSSLFWSYAILASLGIGTLLEYDRVREGRRVAL